MPNTKDGKTRITQLEKNMTQVNKKLDEIQGDLAEIKKCLLGDDRYKQEGVLGQHKEMYSDYTGAKWFLRNIRAITMTVIGLLLALVSVIVKLIIKV
jgi:hypothetical protein